MTVAQPLSYKLNFLLLACLICWKNCIDGGATNNALPFEGGLAILHGYFLSILQFIFLLAFDAIVKVSHNISPYDY